jgi:hypothetical protein
MEDWLHETPEDVVFTFLRDLWVPQVLAAFRDEVGWWIPPFRDLPKR